MAFLTTATGRIFYKSLGAGPPLLLLPGLSRSSRYWGGFDRQLARHFHVITLDARGIGRTSNQAFWGDKTDDLALDALAVLDHLGLHKAHIFGQSLGGMVALTLGLNHPERVASLIVANASTAGLGHWRIYPQALAAMALGALFPPLLYPLLVHLCTGESISPRRKKSFIKIWQKNARLEGIPYLTTFKQLLMATRFQACAILPQLFIPTLIISGGGDRFVPAINSQALFALLPQAELELIPAGGHELSIERPKALVVRIVQFISSLECQKLPRAGQDMPAFPERLTSNHKPS